MFVGVSRAWMVAVAVLSVGLMAHADPLVVKTANGRVHGKALNDGKVKAFEGIPYAAGPVGDLRLEGSAAGEALDE